MMDRPDWATDGRDWPNRAASHFVTAGGIKWHVQIAGTGPDLLLLHGTGAATHSWAGLLPLLALRHRVIAPDLPGHGFTDPAGPDRMSLPGMAALVASLLAEVEGRPGLVVGHSAGAAIGARVVLDGVAAPRALVSLNGALLPLASMPLQVFAPLARWLSATTIAPRLFAFHAADRRVVARLLRDTGSTVPPVSLEFYARLARRAGHAAGALSMMAHWDLGALRHDLGRLPCRLIMINGANDRTIPAAGARNVQALVPGAALISLPGLGHLAHEEAPDLVAAALFTQTGGA